MPRPVAEPRPRPLTEPECERLRRLAALADTGLTPLDALLALARGGLCGPNTTERWQFTKQHRRMTT